MSDGTKIEWAANADGTPGATWNPIRARNKATGAVGWFCVHHSDGCKLCYAEHLNVARFGNGVAFKAQNRDQVEIFVDERTLAKPRHWKKPRTIFVCSMTDLFGEFVTDEMIDSVIYEALCNPQHTFIVLTKRAKRMREYFAKLTQIAEWAINAPIANVWLGVSAECQKTWDDRTAELRATPATLRFVSVEPQLELITPRAGDLNGIGWIIGGGESGRGARPYAIEWGAQMSTRCALDRVPYFQKQVGSQPHWMGERLKLASVKGGDISEWPRAVQLRQRPPLGNHRRTA